MLASPLLLGDMLSLASFRTGDAIDSTSFLVWRKKGTGHDMGTVAGMMVETEKTVNKVLFDHGRKKQTHETHRAPTLAERGGVENAC